MKNKKSTETEKKLNKPQTPWKQGKKGRKLMKKQWKQKWKHVTIKERETVGDFSEDLAKVHDQMEYLVPG